MKITVAIIAVLAMVSAAGAAEQAWFVATTGAAPVTQGAPGTTLVLPDAGTYGIDVYITAVSNYGWETDLKTTVGTATAANFVDIGCGAAGFITTVAQVNPVGFPGDILHYGQAGTAATDFTGRKVASFDLTIGQYSEIIGGNHSDSAGWASDPPFPIQYGAGWAADGQPDTWATGPAITSLPEPGSLILLGLGLVGLLRRR